MKPHLLDCCEAVRGLSANEKDVILALGRQVAFNPGARVLEEGSSGYVFYVLLSGKASVRKAGRHIAEVSTGAILGEMSLFNENVRTGEVTALEPCNLLAIASPEFN